MNPPVSAIVVNWNGETFISECLRSLQGQTYSPLEVMVVDNGSTDQSIPLIRSQFGDGVRLHENGANLGFAAGNNVGFRLTGGKYVVLLNNDATADRHWIAELVKAAESDPGIGMCASKVYSLDKPGILDSAGGLLIYGDGLCRGRGRLEADRGQYDTRQEALLPSGCACLYRRAMLDEIGLFDEDFFAYSDDTDLGLRARIAGWRCAYVPTAVAHHRYSATAGPYSPLKAYLAERNRIWVAVKTFPLPVLLFGPLFTAWRLLLHACAMLARRGVSGKFVEHYSLSTLLLALLKAYISALTGLFKMWGKRREIRKTRKVPYAAFYSWLRTYRISAKELAFKE